MKLYTPLINKALKIAYDAHRGQFDKSGVPYIYHPAAVAGQMDTEDEIITALLHDVIEDTAVTLADLKRRRFPPAVLEALKLLTHKKGGDYTVYLMKIADNPLALKVKLADIAHNNDASRNASLPAKAAEKYRKKYENAVRLLAERAAKREKLLLDAANGVPAAMLGLGIERYWGTYGGLDRPEAFRLIAAALTAWLAENQNDSDRDVLFAAKFLMAMLLRDDGGILSGRAEPFWFEKPFESASGLDQVFMYATGLGTQRNLREAGRIAHRLTYESYPGDRDAYAEDGLLHLLLCAEDGEPLENW